MYSSHIIKLFEEFPETRRWYNEQRHEMVFPNGSHLFFGSAQHPKDLAAYYSAEYADMLIDEAQEFSQGELESLSGSNRCTSNASIIPKTVYTFMPGIAEDTGLPPIGLDYLKRIFVDKKLTVEEQQETWAFVPARAWDNIKWVEKELNALGIGAGKQHVPDSACECQECVYYAWPEEQRMEFFLRSEYGRKLSAISDEGKRNAWIYGIFGKFAGQYFQQFKPERHVITKEEARRRIAPWHLKWPSGDWGYEHPSAFYWHSQDELGRIITYRELWCRQRNEADLGQDIGEASGYYRDHVGKWQKPSGVEDLKANSFPISWDAGKLSKRSDPNFPKSINQLIADALPEDYPRPHPADSSPGSRIAGARLMGNLLDATIGGIPAWQISEDCEHLIQCLPTLVRDPDTPEDVLKVDYSQNQIGDDPYDGCRMGLQFMLGASWKPMEVERAETLAATLKRTEDMTAVHMANLKFEQEARVRFGPLTRPAKWGRR